MQRYRSNRRAGETVARAAAGLFVPNHKPILFRAIVDSSMSLLSTPLCGTVVFSLHPPAGPTRACSADPPASPRTPHRHRDTRHTHTQIYIYVYRQRQSNTDNFPSTGASRRAWWCNPLPWEFLEELRWPHTLLPHPSAHTRTATHPHTHPPTPTHKATNYKPQTSIIEIRITLKLLHPSYYCGA